MERITRVRVIAICLLFFMVVAKYRRLGKRQLRKLKFLLFHFRPILSRMLF